jgi:hypothetical protein
MTGTMGYKAKRLDWEQIKREVLGGETLAEVAARHETNVNRIAKMASREKWNIAGVRRAAAVAVSAGIALAVGKVRREVQEHRETMLVLSMESRRSLAEAIRKGLGYLSGLTEEELLKRHRAVASFSNAAEALFGWRALAVVEGEAAAREVRMANGERDTRAINLELLRCSPEELRRRARAAQAAKVVEVEVRAEEVEKGVGG